MGLVVDSGVFILWERSGRSVDFAQWSNYGEAVISVVTASELLVGVIRADGPNRREKRSAFVEGIITALPPLPINLSIAREHAAIMATLLSQGTMIGTHDLWIGATALSLGFGVLTINVNDFRRIPNLEVIDARDGMPK
jgi:predicted nucleic acid-binding protein